MLILLFSYLSKRKRPTDGQELSAERRESDLQGTTPLMMSKRERQTETERE